MNNFSVKNLSVRNLIPGNFIQPAIGVPLAFVAGFVDTATFLHVSELFSAHITGNLVVFAVALARGVRGADWLKLVALPVFFVGLALATFIYDRARGNIRAVLAFETILLASAGVLALLMRTAAGNAWVGMILVLAMAAQNAAHQLEPRLGATSTVMTTNTAKLFVDLWRGMKPLLKGMPAKSTGIGPRLAFFAFGCVLSAFATHRLGLAAVLLPALLVAAVAVALDGI